MPAFEWRQFGTFIGPQFKTGTYNYETISKEGYWHTDIAIDTSFKKKDLGYVMYSAPGAYVGHHADNISIAKITFESAMGAPIPLYYHMVKTSFINGNVIATGKHIQNGLTTINGQTTLNGNTTSTGTITSPKFVGSINVQSWKGFDIEHPKKKGQRLRHICVEGPEAAVYIRGRCKDTNIINLPDYWDGLVDIDEISVNLTPFGSPQNLFVEQIKWGKQVVIKNADGGPVNCFYQIWAPRLGELHVEYEGKSAADYPGEQDEHSICGYHYDRREE
jgi:hypothetical protein